MSLVRVLVYLADVDLDNNSSFGLINAAVELIRSASKSNGFKYIVLTSKGNHDWLSERLNASDSSNIALYCLPLSVRGLLTRLFFDHFLMPIMMWVLRVDLVYLPKGWMPLVPSSCPCVSLIADAIVCWYDKESSFSVKNIYFNSLLRFSIRRSRAIITVSDFSRKKLLALDSGSDPKINILHQAGGIGSYDRSVEIGRRDILVIGHRNPHKSSEEAILLAARNAPLGEEVLVCGLEGWLDEWDREEPAGVVWLGRISDKELDLRYRTVRALVFISKVEGFGLPAIEAYMRGAPVVYREGTSVAEILSGFKGAWDGDEGSFGDVLKEVLNIPACEIEGCKRLLKKQYSWERASREFRYVMKQSLV